MAEFRVGEHTYRNRPMGAIVQMDVLARLMPLFSAGVTEIIPFVQEMREKGLTIDGVKADVAMQALTPVAKAMASMPDEHRHFVMSSCLSLCERKADGKEGWAEIWNADAKTAMFGDINSDISVMLKIVVNVLRVTFTRFFPESLSGLFGGANP